MHKVIILIKSVLNKDKNHYYYKIFACIIWLKDSQKTFFRSIKMLRFGEAKVTKEKLYAAKKTIKNLDVNVDNIIISKLVKIKANSKYLI